MKIGEVYFEDGDVVQGWNPSDISPATRRIIAKELRSIARHMLKDEFCEGNTEDGDYKYVKRPYRPRKRRTKSTRGRR